MVIRTLSPIFDVFKSLYFSLINTTLGDFVTLGVLFLTFWMNSCLSHNLQTRTLSFTVRNQAMLDRTTFM